MSSTFSECLKTKKIVPSSGAKRLARRELSVAEADLVEARESLARKSCKWA